MDGLPTVEVGWCIDPARDPMSRDTFTVDSGASFTFLPWGVRPPALRPRDPVPLPRLRGLRTAEHVADFMGIEHWLWFEIEGVERLHVHALFVKGWNSFLLGHEPLFRRHRITFDNYGVTPGFSIDDPER